MKKLGNIFILLSFIYLACILKIVSSDELVLGEISIESNIFSIDASAIDTKINYVVDDTITTPKLIITSLSGDVTDIGDIAKVSSNRTSVIFNDFTTISSGTKMIVNYWVIFIISLLSFGLISNRLGHNANGINSIIICFSIIILFATVSNSITLSEVSIRIDIKAPSNYKFESLKIILGSGSSNIVGLVTKSLNIDGCSNVLKDHQITFNQLSIRSSLDVCSRNDISITALQLTSSKVSINLNTTSDVNLNFYNGYNGLIKVNSNLNIEGGCTIKTIGLESNGTCGRGVLSSLNINAVNTNISNVQVSCKTTSTWRPVPASPATPSSPVITTLQPAVEYKYDNINLQFMAQSGYSPSSLTPGPTGVSNSFTINYIANAPNSNWLVAKTPTPTLKAGVNYKFTFSLKLGEIKSKYNDISNMTFSLYNPNHIQDPNGSNQYFKFSQRPALYSKTFSGNFTSSTEFITTTVDIIPFEDIGISVFALQMNRTSKSAPTTSVIYMSNIKFIIPSKAITTLTLLTKDSELVTIPKPPVALDEQDSSTCPYKDTDLVHWHDPSTWSNNVVPSSSSEIIIPAGKRVLISPCSISQTEIYKKITIPASSELIFFDSDMTMHVTDIYVEGKLTMGSKSCRYNAYINLVFHGSKSESNTIAQYYGSKGIAVASTGFISIHGYQYHYTWTKLSATAWSGDIVINIQDNVNWEVGQKVLITTSIYKDEVENQNEVMTIAAIQGKTIQLTEQLKFYHYGGQEYQAEVALLTRRIVFNGDGDNNADIDSFGGHVLINGEGQFSGIQLMKMGQTNIKARYPLHYHLAGTLSNSFISDCSVTNSYYRCYTIHGTNNVTLSNNVAFDIRGHCYYMEDGVEVDNTLKFNLASYVHPIGSPAQGNNQKGQNFVQSASLTQPADSAAGGFYITNAWNTLIGNAASGGWAGFSFPNLDRPIGNHVSTPIVPSQFPLKQFEGNTAHSSGYFFPNGASIYVGGLLTYNDTDGLLYYSSGRYARNTYIDGIAKTGNEQFFRFNNTKLYLSGRGVSHWGTRVEVVRYESHDGIRPVSLFGQAWLDSAIVNGQSGNIVGKDIEEKTRQGFEFYDTNVQTILSNIIFRNYINDPYSTDPEENNMVFIGMTHSDEFKPQGISAIINITIEGTAASQYIGHSTSLDTGSNRYFNFMDYDGSIFSSLGSPKLIGSHDKWWQYDNTCQWSDWSVYICDRGTHEVSTLAFVIPGYIDTDLIDGTTHVGNISLFGNGITDRRTTIVTKNPGVTGVSNNGWYMYLTNGSPTYMKIWVAQVVYGQSILFAIPYPTGTTFSISCDLKGQKAYTKNYTLASSAAQVKSGDGSTYHFDGQHLFIKIVNFALNNSPNEYLERSGAKVYDILKYYFIHITASNTITPPTKPVNGFFTGLPDILPSSTL